MSNAYKLNNKYKMGKQIIVIALLLLTSISQAQVNPLSEKKVDSLSYAMYLNQDWDSLVSLGKKSRNEGIDFYYLKVRMGIAYFKTGKMLSAVKLLEEAYSIDTTNLIVQDYLYWAYRYSGLVLESQLFYKKLSQELKDKIKLKLPFITSIDIGVVTADNNDYSSMIKESANIEVDNTRYFPDGFQNFHIGFNHTLSSSVNFYHKLSVMPFTSVKQENISEVNSSNVYDGTETRYYAGATFALGNRWYLDSYLNFIFGKYDDLETENSSIKYSDYVFGTSLTKSSYYFRNTFNASISNLNGVNQFQGGYTVSVYPFENTLLVPFGSIQFQSENSESRMVYSGGVSLNTKNISVTGYGNFGELQNFVSNNGTIIYNQLAKTVSETGLVFNVYLKKINLKVGYSFMKMEGVIVNEEEQLVSSVYKFNQQSIIGGIVWKF